MNSISSKSAQIFTRLSYPTFTIDPSQSTEHQIHSGVPQRSVIAPILYNIFTVNISQNPSTHLALFADETVLLCYSQSRIIAAKGLQNSLIKWANRWKIKISAEKTQPIFFTERRNLQMSQYQIIKVVIPWITQITYLAIIFDKN